MKVEIKVYTEAEYLYEISAYTIKILIPKRPFKNGASTGIESKLITIKIILFIY